MLAFGATVLRLALLAGSAAPADNASSAPSRASIVDQEEIDLINQSNIVLGVGARALGMGGAFLARPDDATAASWNPAGLSYLRRPEVSIVGTYFESKSDFGVDHTKASGRSLDFLAVTYPLSLGSASGAAQVSYQRVIPFNGSRRTVTPEVVRTYESEGGFDVVGFGFGWKATRTLRTGGTLNRWINGYVQNFERTPRRRTERTDSFDIDGWNVNLGLIWSPIEELNIGVVGKTPFTADVVLDRKRTDFVTDPDGGPDIENEAAYSSDAVRLKFPGAFGVGLSWRPLSTLTLAADFTRTYWSNARIENYFTLLDVPETEAGGPTNTFDSLVWPDVNAESQADAVQMRFGVEHVMIRGRIKVPFRVGYVNDQQYTKDAAGKAHRFNAFTAGTGFIIGPALFDVAYQFVAGKYDAVGTQGPIPFSITAHSFYTSLIYRWGGIR